MKKRPLWQIICFVIGFVIVIGYLFLRIEIAVENRRIDRHLESSQELRKSHEILMAETQDYIKEQEALIESLKPKLELQDWNVKKSYGYTVAEGRVKNISNKTLKNIEAVVEFYTEEDIFISSESALIEYQSLLPQQSSPFKVTENKNPLMENAKISFKELMGDQVFYRKKGE